MPNKHIKHAKKNIHNKSSKGRTYCLINLERTMKSSHERVHNDKVKHSKSQHHGNEHSLFVLQILNVTPKIPIYYF